MYALLVIVALGLNVTSSVTYFADKDACETQATFMNTDMRDNASNWVTHVYIHCMPLATKGD